MLDQHPKKILIVTYQVGCALQILPVAKKLLEKSHELSFIASGASFSLINNHFPNVRNISDEASKKQIQDIICKENPDLIITGTDVFKSLEFNFRVIAKKTEVPVITIIDSWGHYKTRFFRDDNSLDSIPNEIIAIDQLAFNELRGIGIPKDIIHICGSPHFEYLHHKYKSLQIKTSNNKNILFLSQPISSMYGEDLGVTELVALEALCKKLQDEFREYHLVIKPHPREDQFKMEDLLKKLNFKNYKFASNQANLYELILNASFVTGIYSNALIESLILKRPTLSLQINTNSTFPFRGNQLKYMNIAHNLEDISSFFNQEDSTQNSGINDMFKDARKNICIICNNYLEGP